MDDITRLFEILEAGDPGSLVELFSGKPVLDDPRSGRVTGVTELENFVYQYPAWSGGLGSELLSLTQSRIRDVAEYVLRIKKDDDTLELPAAAAGDRDGSGYASIRIYHSLWPLLGEHVFRGSLLPEDRELEIPDAVGAYHTALTDGDLDGIMSVFEDDGYAREPAGGEWVYRGRERLREFYGLLFAGGGGILLQHCTLTDDGVRSALEYNAMKWGSTDLGGQAGIAVYERGISGLLHAARIYDDVDPPA